MFKFEKLVVWQKSVDFAELIYRLSRPFPADERFGLTNQIRRAANSISSNIAEGSARTDPDFARFIGYATGSVFEVVTQTRIALNQSFISPEDHDTIYQSAEEISRMLSGLRDSLGN